jgi:hypothetical protein
MGSDLLELGKAVLTIVGAIAAAWLTARFNRKSQQESTQITLLTAVMNTVQEERDKAVLKEQATAAQIPRWRRYVQRLHRQIYTLGGTPEDADAELEL